MAKTKSSPKVALLSFFRNALSARFRERSRSGIGPRFSFRVEGEIKSRSRSGEEGTAAGRPSGRDNACLRIRHDRHPSLESESVFFATLCSLSFESRKHSFHEREREGEHNRVTLVVVVVVVFFFASSSCGGRRVPKLNYFVPVFSRLMLRCDTVLFVSRALHSEGWMNRPVERVYTLTFGKLRICPAAKNKLWKGKYLIRRKGKKKKIRLIECLKPTTKRQEIETLRN